MVVVWDPSACPELHAPSCMPRLHALRPCPEWGPRSTTPECMAAGLCGRSVWPKRMSRECARSACTKSVPRKCAPSARPAPHGCLACMPRAHAQRACPECMPHVPRVSGCLECVLAWPSLATFGPSFKSFDQAVGQICVKVVKIGVSRPNWPMLVKFDKKWLNWGQIRPNLADWVEFGQSLVDTKLHLNIGICLSKFGFKLAKLCQHLARIFERWSKLGRNSSPEATFRQPLGPPEKKKQEFCDHGICLRRFPGARTRGWWKCVSSQTRFKLGWSFRGCR